MTKSVRTLLAAGGVLGASLVGAPFALAQHGANDASFSESAATFPQSALQEDGVAAASVLLEPDASLQQEEQSAITLDLRGNYERRFSPDLTTVESGEGPRRFELEFAAAGDRAGVPLDISVARRQSFGADENGDIDRSGRGSELRVGRGLVQQADRPSQGSTVYMFVASDDEALTWQPGQTGELGGRRSGFSLEDRVEVGDVSAGVTYERNGVQASLAYVEREISARVGHSSYSQDERFAGVTVTMRR